ncbi:uncharacterized protein PHACADRAFT_199948 [Phanerochaete carnosa HHB-10118-sp]|uniref:CBM1 domain-containing protein n=1 Tax=Phanerochaete carnosa (strain HHB-10118-sp) TaxID=650164 RepID=K5VWY2_PHACS|nr:uncharacterized protein PHACADRAFT_199948 [Phanerochaete carnosa HHB-10118-sp]EKM51114.1 hypothetical protein PHACADRAFT_199948 [Phanerochaete carnosa HHB-10118-sp]
MFVRYRRRLPYFLASSSASSADADGHWHHNGGIGYTGPTVCSVPYTCVVSNLYYNRWSVSISYCFVLFHVYTPDDP